MGEFIAVSVSAVIVCIICWYANKLNNEVQRTQNELIKLLVKYLALLAEEKHGDTAETHQN